MTTPFWLNDPTVLLKQEYITQIWPTASMTSDEKLNSITRMVILLTVIGYLLSRTLKILVTGIVTLGAIIILRYAQLRKDNTKQEGYHSLSSYNTNPSNFHKPTSNNPSMNVLLTEIKDNPTRKPAAPAYNPAVVKQINKDTQEFIMNNFDDNKDIDKRLFKDLGDSYTFDQSMRTWYATANTQVPNDQKAFLDFCYGDMPSCKDNQNNCNNSVAIHSSN
tara:strand:- start:1833 stop:2492 length:660 start_codon:yes stop_codon:yes gene_type:complete